MFSTTPENVNLHLENVNLDSEKVNSTENSSLIFLKSITKLIYRSLLLIWITIIKEGINENITILHEAEVNVNHIVIV